MVNTSIKAVIWDFGGVFTSSPFDNFNEYEARNGLPKDTIRNINAANPDVNAWAKMERSEVSHAEFDSLFAAEAKALGFDIPGCDVLELIRTKPRPNVARALEQCKEHFRVGCITNNMSVGKGAGMTDKSEIAQQFAQIFSSFEYVIESSKAGVRKPEPKIYQMMCDALNVKPDTCIYLDDLGINLKPARAMGMRTIKVVSEAQLLADLATETGLIFE